MAIYYLTRWMSSAGKKVRVVELGPGRGTLMDDMLRVRVFMDAHLQWLTWSDFFHLSIDIVRNNVDCPG